MTRPFLAADFADGRPSSPELVERAAQRGAAFVAVDVTDDGEGRPEALLGEHRVARLSRVVMDARRAGVGLVLRLTDTLPVAGLADALGVATTDTPALLRARLLVVVDGERVGRRLRKDAPSLPSAYETPRSGLRGLDRIASENHRRAAADADDLVIAWRGAATANKAARLVPHLALRGARVFVAGVPEGDVADAASLAVAGLIVRCGFDGGALLR